MKLYIQNFSFKGLYLLIATVLFNAALFAQDSTSTAITTTSSQTTTDRTWYMEPWAWVVGGVIVVLIIVALTRSGGSSSTDRVTVTKTVDRETGI